MRRQGEMQAPGAGRRGDFADQVALRPHLDGAVVGQVAVIHRKAIVMFGHRHDIAGAGVAEQLGPYGGIELIRLEQRNKVLVAELGLRTVGLDVMGIFRTALDIHVARIPFAAEGRDRIQPPVHKDAELGIGVPLRRFIGLKRRPIGAERPIAVALIDDGQ